MTASQVRRLALPAILHSLLQTLVFVVDRIMLGRHGDTSLAAMQLGGTVEWSIFSVFAAFEVGTIARVGRHVGAREPQKARFAAWISITLSLAVGSALALGSPFLLRLLPVVAPRVSPAALGEAHRYLAVTVAASPMVFLAMTTTAALQAGGDTRTPLAIGIVSNIVHLGLNRALILGVAGVPALGARGAGISTAVTFTLQAVLATAALTSRARPVSLRAVATEPGTEAASGAEEWTAFGRVAGPAMLERVLYHVGYLSYVLLVVKLGDATMAANQSLISVESICFLSADGFGIASAALVAQRLGAGDPEGAREAAKLSARDAAVLLTVFGLAAFALRDQILPMFSRDSEILAIGRATVPMLAIAQPFMAIGIVLSQSVRGAGRTREALFVSVAGAIVVRISATWFFGHAMGLGLVGVWIGSTLDWMVRSALLAWVASRVLTPPKRL